MAKHHIEQHIVSTYATRFERFEALRLACPAVMAMHLYRQVRLYSSGNLDSVRLSWQRKEAITKPNKVSLLQSVEQELAAAAADYKVVLELLYDAIEQTPGERLRLRRPVKVQPVANIVADGQLTTVTAPMPIIVVQNKPFDIKLMSDFVAEVQRKTRSDKRATTKLGTMRGITVESIAKY